MKNSNDTIGNRTRDLPTCSAVPQPTVPPRTPSIGIGYAFSSLLVYVLLHKYQSKHCSYIITQLYIFKVTCVELAKLEV